MARRFAQKRQIFDEPDEKNEDATSDRDHEGENKTVDRRIYPAEGYICREKFYRQELYQPAVFFFQGNRS